MLRECPERKRGDVLSVRFALLTVSRGGNHETAADRRDRNGPARGGPGRPERRAADLQRGMLIVPLPRSEVSTEGLR
jgi:hypothetical protein